MQANVKYCTAHCFAKSLNNNSQCVSDESLHLFCVLVIAAWPHKVDVEKVIGQIRQGGTQAETVIRGQHEQLTGAIDREQRTKRELVSSLSSDIVLSL